MTREELVEHYNREHVEIETGGTMVSRDVDLGTIEGLHVDHHSAMDLEHSHDGMREQIGRRESLDDAEAALAGAVAHLETVTQVLADWNAPQPWGPAAIAARAEEFARATRWDAVYRESEDVLRRLLNLTGKIGGLK